MYSTVHMCEYSTLYCAIGWDDFGLTQPLPGPLEGLHDGVDAGVEGGRAQSVH